MGIRAAFSLMSLDGSLLVPIQNGLRGAGVQEYGQPGEPMKPGGESGILLPPLSASHDEHYTSAIIPCVLAGYKRIRTLGTVSIVSATACVYGQKGITGISADLDGYACLS
jgi:hypothetical protein